MSTCMCVCVSVSVWARGWRETDVRRVPECACLSPSLSSQPSRSGLKKVCVRSLPSSSGMEKGSLLMLSKRFWPEKEGRERQAVKFTAVGAGPGGAGPVWPLAWCWAFGQTLLVSSLVPGLLGKTLPGAPRPTGAPPAPSPCHGSPCAEGVKVTPKRLPIASPTAPTLSVCQYFKFTLLAGVDLPKWGRSSREGPGVTTPRLPPGPGLKQAGNCLLTEWMLSPLIPRNPASGVKMHCGTRALTLGSGRPG